MTKIFTSIIADIIVSCIKHLHNFRQDNLFQIIDGNNFVSFSVFIIGNYTGMLYKVLRKISLFYLVLVFTKLQFSSVNALLALLRNKYINISTTVMANSPHIFSWPNHYPNSYHSKWAHAYKSNRPMR